MSQFLGKKLSILIPDIAKLDDEDMHVIAPIRDGRWSEQTRSLLAKFETQKLDLNRGWAATWIGWSCPCCKRSKRQIARVTPRGVLQCHLELHHDHLDDYLKRRFSEINPPSDEPDRRIQVSHAEAALRQLVERFERTLVCVDCNLADGRVKLALREEIDAHFTFTPSEIAEFITVHDNQLHDVDFASARSIWGNAREDFEDRVDFAGRIAKRIANGRYTREVAPGQKFQGQLQTRDICFQLCAEQFPDIHSLHLGETIEARSVARDGVGGKSRSFDRQLGLAPTDAEFASIDAAQVSMNKHWRDAGETWECPCCERTKRDICRRSSRGVWTAKIQLFEGFEIETDPEQLSWRRQNGAGDIVISAPKRELICQDCRGIVTQVRQQKADLDARALTLGDLRGLAAASAKNITHDVDITRAKEIVAKNVALLDAIVEFEAHKRLTTKIWIEHMKLLKGGLSDAQARDQIGYELVKVRDWDFEEGIDLVDWLLEEAARLQNIEIG